VLQTIPAKIRKHAKILANQVPNAASITQFKPARPTKTAVTSGKQKNNAALKSAMKVPILV
jgi:hypothetical protein